MICSEIAGRAMNPGPPLNKELYTAIENFKIEFRNRRMRLPFVRSPGDVGEKNLADPNRYKAVQPAAVVLMPMCVFYPTCGTAVCTCLNWGTSFDVA